MESHASSSLKETLFKERDRSVLLASLTAAAAELPVEVLFGLFVDVLLACHKDRDSLKIRIAQLLAARFGKSSEKATDAQLALFASAVEVLKPPPPPLSAAAAKEDAPVDDVPSLLAQTEMEIQELVDAERAEQAARRDEAKRRREEASKTEGAAESVSWPTHLPNRVVMVDVPPDMQSCADPDCDRMRQVIGQETSWHIERKVTVEIVVTHRLIRACGAHHGGPVTTPAPPKPVDKGHLSFALAAHAIHLRYSHNLPIRRIVDLLADDLVPVSEEMLDTLFTATSERIEPVLAALVATVRRSRVVNVDDTKVLILDPKVEGRRRLGRIWVAIGDRRFAWYFATSSWKSEEAESRLGALTGTLQGDGYQGFRRMALLLRIRLAGCMSHLRRKLRQAFLAKDPRAAVAMGLVQGLYRVEALARAKKVDEDGLLALRKSRSGPIMAALGRWARDVASGIEPKSPLGRAWTYLNNQWDTLQTYLTDSAVSIDNNAAERALRRIAIGRKLWLFYRSDRTAERATRLTSLLMTARLHGANERAYLGWLLAEVARREWSVEAAAGLLPAAWLALKKEPKEGAAAEA